MKKYFIGGLGSNVYHSKDFLQELNSQVYFLNPYEKHLRDETELKSWFKNEIVEEESICPDRSFSWRRFGALPCIGIL